MEQPADEQEIIRRVLQGDQRAYALLVNRYMNYVFTIALRHVSSREAAEELAQDTFVKAYRSLADFRGTSKFSTWLYTIVHNTCLSFLRKKAEGTVLMEHEQMAAMADRFTEQANASGRTEQRSLKRILDIGIRELPSADAQIVSLFYQAEQTMEEIGLIMGLTPNNVKIRLFRARQKLRTILERDYSKNELIN